MPFGLSAGAVAAIGAGVSAATGVAGTIMSANKAGQGAQQAQQDLSQQRTDLQPWRDTGGQALGASADLMGLNGPDAASAAMSNFQQGPGYQWQLGQGLRAIDAGNAAKGILRSGATEKAEMTYGEGLANQSFQQYYNNLAGISGQGLTAATGGASTAATGANLAQGAGNTQGSIYGNLASGVGNTVNSLFSNPAVKTWLTGSSPTPAPLTVDQLY
jgi:hypothetical protein